MSLSEKILLCLLIPTKVFMTRTDALKCFHEPFGDAFYYGPERLSSRYENDTKAREDCGFSQSTYQTILESFDRETSSEVRSTPSSTAPLVTAPGSPLPCLLSDHRVSEALVSPTGCSNCIDLAFCFLHTTLAMVIPATAPMHRPGISFCPSSIWTALVLFLQFMNLPLSVAIVLSSKNDSGA